MTRPSPGFSAFLVAALLSGFLSGCASLGVLQYGEGEAKAGSSLIRVALVSDLHIRGSSPALDEALSAITKARPDLVIFAGDLSAETTDLAVARAWLAGLPRESARFAVLGNWDRSRKGGEPGVLQAMYEAAGVRLLVNEGLALDIRGREVWVYGYDDYLLGAPAGGQPEPEGTDIAIHVVHEPEYASTIAGLPLREGTIRVILSGHTHGGQVRLGTASALPHSGDGPFLAGRYRVGDSLLFVSRGVGTSHLPIRVGADPDVIIIDF